MALTIAFGTWYKAFTAWFWTNLLALLLMALFMCRFAFTDSNYHFGNELRIVGAVGARAALLSLPIVPLAYFLFQWIFSFHGRTNRIPKATITILLIFGLMTMAIRVLVTEREMDYVGFFIGFFYLPASLLANAFVYRSALFRPDSYASESNV